MDIFGDALRDRQVGHTGRMLTIRRDDDHVDQHDPGLYFLPEPFAHETELLALAKGPVLDVGCGAGRTVLWLQRKGLNVTGIDMSPGAVAVARARGCRDVILGDVMASGAPLPRSHFETIVVFGNNVGIGGTRDGATTLLRHLARVAAPGGQLLVTGLDVARTDAPHHLAYHQRNVATGRPKGEISMRFEYAGAIGPWTPWYHPEPHELEQIAADSGWRVSQLRPAGGPFFASVLSRAER
ncbi:MAG: class I SAM-dependent methyltransferase [Tateyamaria sp.]